jgi:hypothetical protein
MAYLIKEGKFVATNRRHDIIERQKACEFLQGVHKILLLVDEVLHWESEEETYAKDYVQLADDGDHIPTIKFEDIPRSTIRSGSRSADG